MVDLSKIQISERPDEKLLFNTVVTGALTVTYEVRKDSRVMVDPDQVLNVIRTSIFHLIYGGLRPAVRKAQVIAMRECASEESQQELINAFNEINSLITMPK